MIGCVRSRLCSHLTTILGNPLIVLLALQTSSVFLSLPLPLELKGQSRSDRKIPAGPGTGVLYVLLWRQLARHRPHQHSLVFIPDSRLRPRLVWQSWRTSRVVEVFVVDETSLTGKTSRQTRTERTISVSYKTCQCNSTNSFTALFCSTFLDGTCWAVAKGA